MELLILPFSRYFTGAYISAQMKEIWSKTDSALYRNSKGLQVYLPKGQCIGGKSAIDEWHKVERHMPKYFSTLPHYIGKLKYRELSKEFHCIYIQDTAQNNLDALAKKNINSSWLQILRFYQNKPTASHYLHGQIYIHRDFDRVFSKGKDIFASIHTLEKELNLLLKIDDLPEEENKTIKLWKKAILLSKKHHLPLIKNSILA